MLVTSSEMRRAQSSRMLAAMVRVKKLDGMRIVSLAPSVTSILLSLGAGHELVGVSRWCKEVADVGGRPAVGDCWKIKMREVMRLRPSILIGSVPFAADTVQKILAEPVAFLAINPRSLADIYSDIRTLGRLVERGRPAERLIRKMQSGFLDVAREARRLGAGRQVRVYCEAWPKPRISSPPWVAELVEIAGGKMVVSAGSRVTDEEVARGAPELIVLAWAATGGRAKVSSALRNLAWRDVPAVRNGRVVVIRDELLNTPGPPLADGARELARAFRECAC
jgi:iron complex transport system substrate-binding protein